MSVSVRYRLYSWMWHNPVPTWSYFQQVPSPDVFELISKSSDISGDFLERQCCEWKQEHPITYSARYTGRVTLADRVFLRSIVTILLQNFKAHSQSINSTLENLKWSPHSPKLECHVSLCSGSDSGLPLSSTCAFLFGTSITFTGYLLKWSLKTWIMWLRVFRRAHRADDSLLCCIIIW